MSSTTSVRDSLAAQSLLTIHDPEACPDDIRDAVAWIKASPENQEAFDRANAFWVQCDALADGPAISAKFTRRRSWRPRGLAVFAGALAAAACVSVAIFAVTPKLIGYGRTQPEAAEVHAYSTKSGEIKTIRLVDGSEITLGGASSLSFQSTPNHRLVVLSDGEAMFDVTKDPTRPFTVMSGEGSTTALGTRFSVRKSPDEVRVVLARGSVKVATGKGGTSSAILTPGTQVAYSGTMLHDLTTIDAEAAMAWPQGRIFFLREPLRSVVYSLNRYSTKQIIIEGDIGNTPVSGVADLDDILPWLQAVAQVVGAQVVESEDAFRISSPKRTKVAAVPTLSKTNSAHPST